MSSVRSYGILYGNQKIDVKGYLRTDDIRFASEASKPKCHQSDPIVLFMVLNVHEYALPAFTEHIKSVTVRSVGPFVNARS